MRPSRQQVAAEMNVNAVPPERLERRVVAFAPRVELRVGQLLADSPCELQIILVGGHVIADPVLLRERIAPPDVHGDRHLLVPEQMHQGRELRAQQGAQAAQERGGEIPVHAPGRRVLHDLLRKPVRQHAIRRGALPASPAGSQDQRALNEKALRALGPEQPPRLAAYVDAVHRLSPFQSAAELHTARGRQGHTLHDARRLCTKAILLPPDVQTWSGVLAS
mmetsp:Transcript_96743/g.273327  ORF Transcript_96743/g.273327 Transcript_96743/m.273327 type:complete len:221 (+) Transcript_96743:327-989(+)